MKEVVVLAGGLGTRLRSVVADRPKPMALIAGKPFLEWQLRVLAARGAQSCVLAIGYLGEQIQAHFGSQFLGMQVAYSVEDTPLGTGGAIARALTQCKSDWVYVVNGDTYSTLPWPEMESVRGKGNECVVAVTEVANPQRYGAVLWDEHSGRVRSFLEKSAVASDAKLAWINSGAYLLNKAAFLARGFPERFSFEADYLQKIVAEGALCAAPAGSAFIDIGIPEDFERAQHYLPSLIAA
jgi:D-glycero-alpha-D-manno-heptose 1-phosphate guanylyltransferase